MPCSAKTPAGRGQAAQREKPKTTLFGFDPRVSHRKCDREVYDKAQCGFLKRTSRGRMVTAKAYKHLNMLG